MNKKIIFSLLLLMTTVGAKASTAPKNNASDDPDGGWPRVITSEGGSKIQIFQPQVESWQDQQKIVAWTAVECLMAGKTSSEMGVVEWEALTSVSLEARLVELENIQIHQVSFPTLNSSQSREVTAALKELFPKYGVVFSLDRILAAIDKSALRFGNVSINTNPPPIFYANRPAVLVQFDGEPIVSPIKESELKFIVNTNWDILLDSSTGSYYLRHGKHWLTSKSLETGWTLVKSLPKSFSSIPKDSNWADVHESIPTKSMSKSDIPLVFTSKEPAELIVTKGKPKLEPIGESKLLWISNTECDVFQIKDGAYYFAVSGRWFRAEKLEGPWTFATPELPAEFLNIPRTHPRSRVRSSIPGTDEATEAVLLAQIPQSLRISRKGLQAIEVKYQGDPEFKEVKDTKVSYATNSSNDVLRVGDMYYLCYQGAWFQSRRADGPWDLATSVPAEIYKIPPECPLYHVTYVKVGSSDAESVTYVCNSGYSGVTVSFGVAMYGTGWYYPPYYRYGGYYPVYYPYRPSYGAYPIYNPRTGAYGYGSTVSGPYGGISHAATYNPNTGTYARGSAAWGPGGVSAHGQAYNPRTGTSLETNQHRNSQGSWGNTKVERGDDWVQSGHAKNDQGKVSGIRSSEGDGVVRAKGENGSGFVGKKGDDIYAGKDGNVYRKTEDGWQQHGEGGWSDIDRGEPKASTRDQVNGSRPSAGTSDRVGAGGRQPSAGTRDQLNRDSGSRASGNQRTRDYSSQGRTSNRSSGGGSYSGSRGGGSYGGGGGGGRRR